MVPMVRRFKSERPINTIRSYRPWVSTGRNDGAPDVAHLDACCFQHRVGLADPGRGTEEIVSLPRRASSSARARARGARRDPDGAPTRVTSVGRSTSRPALRLFEARLRSSHVDARLSPRKPRSAARCLP